MITKKITYTICALLVIILSIGAVKITNDIKMAIPYGVMLYNEKGIVSVDDYNMRESDDTKDITAYTMTCGYIKANSNSTQVDILLTDTKYPDIVPIKMIKGSWFDVSLLKRENNSVVVGTDFAAECFFTTDIIGNEVEIDRRIYTICGVYESNDGLIHDLSGGGRYIVYLPNTSLENTKLDFMIINQTQGERMSATDINKKIYDSYMIEHLNYNISSTGDRLDLIQSYPYIFIKVLIILVLILLATASAQFIIKAVYNRDDDRKRMLISLFCSLILFSGLIYVFYCLPRIPDVFLPNENVFDIKYYITRYVTEVQNLNNSPKNYFDTRLVKTFEALTIMYASISFIISILLTGFTSKKTRILQENPRISEFD